MSVLTAIIQAILQAITWVFPVSESGHSSLFHDFSDRYSGACSAITGVIHIAIAVGIVIALRKVFLSLSKEFVNTFPDIFKKKFSLKNASPARSFMLMTVLSFVPMLLWLIPAGDYGTFYNLLRSTGFNGTVLDDGLFFIITGLLMLAAAKQLSIARNNKNVSIVCALVVGFVCVLLVPVAGLSPVAGIFAVTMLMGVSKKLAFRYCFVMSVPLLIVTGIVEICISVTPAGIVSIILALIIAAAVTVLAVKILLWMIETVKIKYFAIYDFAIGIIACIIGIFEIALK